MQELWYGCCRSTIVVQLQYGNFLLGTECKEIKLPNFKPGEAPGSHSARGNTEIFWYGMIASAKLKSISASKF